MGRQSDDDDDDDTIQTDLKMRSMGYHCFDVQRRRLCVLCWLSTINVYTCIWTPVLMLHTRAHGIALPLMDLVTAVSFPRPRALHVQLYLRTILFA